MSAHQHMSVKNNEPGDSGKRLIILILIVLLFNSSCGFLETPPNTPNDWHIALDRVTTSLLTLPTVVKLMQHNETCDIPCFWGLRPGQTTSLEVQGFMDKKFGILSGNTVRLHLGRWQGISFLVDFNVDDDTLRYIDIFVKPPLLSSSISLPSIMKQLETEPDIYFFAHSRTRIFVISIVNNEQGVLAEYTFRFGPDQRFGPNHPILICPRFRQNSNIKIWLQSSSEEISIQDRIRPTLYPSEFHKPLQDVIGISPQEFMERIISDPNGCFETSTYEVY